MFEAFFRLQGPESTLLWLSVAFWAPAMVAFGVALLRGRFDHLPFTRQLLLGTHSGSLG